MIPNAEKIIERAQRGEKPSTADRRHALSFLILRGQTDTNAALGELFKVSERQVRLDKQWLREQKAKTIRNDDPGLVIADLMMSYEKEIRNVERSMAKCKLGSRVYLEHAKTLFKMQLEKIKAMQDLGYLPKNLGNMSVTKYEYSALVGKDGSVETRPVDLSFEDVEVLPAPASETLLLPTAAEIAELES